MTLSQWLLHASQKLKAVGIDSNRLDAELILADTLGCERVYLHAHGDQPLTARYTADAQAKLERREAREPLAYIFGHKEFYGREFAVTPNVLIPRPETEALVELLLELSLPDHASVVDVGTGSGAIAVTLKLEQPTLDVTASDINASSLAVARKNAALLGADLHFMQGSLLEPIGKPPDAIVANLPYVDPMWMRSPETNYEPSLALFAQESGLALISWLIRQAARLQTPGSYMLLEADPQQHDQIVTIAAEYEAYSLLASRDFALVFQK